MFSQNDAQCQAYIDHIVDSIKMTHLKLMQGRKKEDAYLNYQDMMLITMALKDKIRQDTGLKIIPHQITVACNLAEACLAPSKIDRKRILKNTLSLASGISGVGMVIAGVGSALGWSSSIVATVTVFFTGATLGEPISLACSGVFLTAMAGYFTFKTSNKEKASELALKVLINGIEKAIKEVWKENGAKMISS